MISHHDSGSWKPLWFSFLWNSGTLVQEYSVWYGITMGAVNTYDSRFRERIYCCQLKYAFDVVYSKAVTMADKLRGEHKKFTIIRQKFVISNSEIKDSQFGTFESKLIDKDGLENNKDSIS